MLRRMLGALGVLFTVVCSSSFAVSAASAAENSILVAYFSGTGTTERVAKMLSEQLGADLYRINAKDPFTAEDLSYDPDSRANQEKQHLDLRPEIADQVSNMEQYDTVLIGYPIWSERAPRIIATFLESYDFADKTLIPFCTAYTSGIENSEQELRELYPQLKWVHGQKFSRTTTPEEVGVWLQQLQLKP